METRVGRLSFPGRRQEHHSSTPPSLPFLCSDPSSGPFRTRPSVSVSGLHRNSRWLGSVRGSDPLLYLRPTCHRRTPEQSVHMDTTFYAYVSVPCPQTLTRIHTHTHKDTHRDLTHVDKCMDKRVRARRRTRGVCTTRTPRGVWGSGVRNKRVRGFRNSIRSLTGSTVPSKHPKGPRTKRGPYFRQCILLLLRNPRLKVRVREGRVGSHIRGVPLPSSRVPTSGNLGGNGHP